MSTVSALQLFITGSILLFFLRPYNTLLMDAFKVMLRLAVVGLILQVVPAGWIDSWSRSAAGWAGISATYVPVICLITLIALSTANLIMLNGTTVEQVMRIVLYVIGGVFTAGSANWIAWETSIGKVVGGIGGVISSTAKIFFAVMPS